jgi:hypothetical protein
MNRRMVPGAEEIRAALGVDLTLLDCFQANVAMVLLLGDVADLTSVLGAQWWFRDAEPEPEFTFEPEAVRIERMTGLRAVESSPLPGGIREFCANALRSGLPPVVISDAYLLPWVPYAGRRHIDHSFVVTGVGNAGISFTDLYMNRTEWGDARPLDGDLDATVLGRLDRCPRTRARTFEAVGAPDDQPGSLARLAVANRSALGSWGPGDYLAMTRRHIGTPAGIEALAEITWAVHRRRRLYGEWLTGADRQCPGLFPPRFAERFQQQVGRSWAEASRFAYLSARRMRAGRSPAAVTGPIEAAAAAEDLLRTEWLTHA